MNSQDNLVHELSELLSIEAGIWGNVIGVTSPKAYAMAGIEDKLAIEIIEPKKKYRLKILK